MSEELSYEEINHIAQWVIINRDPLYLSYSPENKESFRLSLKDDDNLYEDIKKAIEKLDYEDEEANTYYSNLVLEEIIGVGQDRFRFCEHGNGGKVTEDTTILQFYNNFEDEQIEFSLNSNNNHTRHFKDRSILEGMGYWARAIIKGSLNYLNISSMEYHVSWDLEDIIDEEIALLLPHEYVEGPNHGAIDKDTGFSQWDFRLEAGGKEEVVKQLRLWTMTHLIPKFSHKIANNELLKSPRVYFFRSKDFHLPYNPSYDVVFSSPEAASMVKAGSFEKDVNNLLKSFKGVISGYLATYKGEMIAELEIKLAELLKNFDPKVTNINKPKEIKVFIAGDNL